MEETNFLNTGESPESAHLARPRLRVGRALAIFLAVLFLITALLVFCGIKAGLALSSAVRAVSEAKDSAMALDFESAKESFAVADKRFDEAGKYLKVFSLTRPVPYIGAQVRAARELINVSKNISQTMGEVMDLANEAIRTPSFSFESVSSAHKRAFLEKLERMAPDLESAKINIEFLFGNLESFARAKTASAFYKPLAKPILELREFERALDGFIPIAILVPKLAGLGEEQQHLILFLNNTEMRPGGGFIGSFGKLRVKDGEIIDFETHDVMAVDGPVAQTHKLIPPLPIKEYLNNEAWFFRDSNWSPDFAVSSEQGLQIYELETGAPTGFESVIGFTPDVLSDVMKIVGNVTIAEQTFTSENITEALEYQVEFGFAEKGIHPAQRKEIIGELADVIIGRLSALPPSRWLDVLEIINGNITQKHIVFYSKDAAIEDVILKKKWGGRIFPGQSDNLMVVDANLASLKTDTAVERNIEYKIRKTDDGRYIATVSVTYKNHGNFDWKTTRYRTYTRVFAPLGSKFLRADGTLANDKLKNPNLNAGKVDVVNELGMTSFGTFTSIEPGEERTLSIQYELPETVAKTIEKNKYSLNILKQIGSFDHALTINLDFGKKIRRADPPEQEIDFGDAKYKLNTILDQDKIFTVGF